MMVQVVEGEAAAMNEERRKVLEMLAAGTVTPEQADRLLDALGAREDIGENGGEQPATHEEPARAADPVMHLTHEQIIEARMMDVDGAYIREMHALFPEGIAFRQIVDAKIHDLDPTYVREMRALGLGDLPPERLIEAKIHDLDPAYVRGMRAAGLGDFTIEQLIQMKIHDVDPATYRELRAL